MGVLRLACLDSLAQTRSCARMGFEIPQKHTPKPLWLLVFPPRQQPFDTKQ
jgi:hypothetical protein